MRGAYSYPSFGAHVRHCLPLKRVLMCTYCVYCSGCDVRRLCSTLQIVLTRIASQGWAVLGCWLTLACCAEVGKAFCALPPPQEGDREALAMPIKNTIFLAGEATHPAVNPCIQAAIETGHRAAEQVATDIQQRAAKL